MTEDLSSDPTTTSATDDGYDLIARLVFDAIAANFGSLP